MYFVVDNGMFWGRNGWTKNRQDADTFTKEEAIIRAAKFSPDPRKHVRALTERDKLILACRLAVQADRAKRGRRTA